MGWVVKGPNVLGKVNGLCSKCNGFVWGDEFIDEWNMPINLRSSQGNRMAWRW